MAAEGTLLTSSSNQHFMSLVRYLECLGLGGRVLILGVVWGFFGFCLFFFFSSSSLYNKLLHCLFKWYS